MFVKRHFSVFCSRPLKNPPVVFPVHVLLSSKQYDIINNAILKNIALVCVTSRIPIDLEQVSYLLLPDGTKLMAP